MTAQGCLEIQKAELLAALKSIQKKVKDVKGEQTLHIGFVDDQAVLSTPGMRVAIAASGDWPGMASIKLTHMLSFLVGEPAGTLLQMSYADSKLRIGTSRLPAHWTAADPEVAGKELSKHGRLPSSTLIMRFKCPGCKKKQGIALDSADAGPLASEALKQLIKQAEITDDGFGCLSCGHTWADQVV